MAIKADLTLSNGVKTDYHIISRIEVDKDKNIIIVYLDNFINKSYYDLSQKKQELLNKQQDKEKDFDILNNKEKLTKTQKTKLDDLAKEINDLANEISNYKDYYNYVTNTTFIEIPLIDNFSEENLEKELKRLKLI